MITERREHIRIAQRVAISADAGRTAPNGEVFDHKFIASTELMASDHGVILLDAWDWTRYLERPRWIAMHDLSGWTGKLNEVTLGCGVHVAIESGFDPPRVGPSGKALCVYVRYAQTQFAQEVRTLYEQGGLDDVSVRWDWKSEERRPPFPEELKKYGDGVEWICTHAELVELSAVLLGADSGAQIVRAGVIEAFERCRSKDIALPAIEQLIASADEPFIDIEAVRADRRPFIDIEAIRRDRTPVMDRLFEAYRRLSR